jgi:serpin B
MRIGLSAVIMVAVIILSCAVATGDPGVEEIRSEVEREMNPQVSEADLATLVEGNTQFAFDLYRAIEERDHNLVYSPYSLSVTIAMVYAGARGDTDRDIASALGYHLPQEVLHPAFNALDQHFNEIPFQDSAYRGEPFTLTVANSVWAQSGYPFEQDYLDLLARNYAEGMYTTDFHFAGDESCDAINHWIENHTNDRIHDACPRDLIHASTQLVLVNAIYFKASWDEEFFESATHQEDFYLIDNSVVRVPMMHKQMLDNYFENASFQAAELPYKNKTCSMLIILPKRNRFREVEASLTEHILGTIFSDMSEASYMLELPRFNFETSMRLKEPLSDLGMACAFQIGRANLTGMNPYDDLFIDDVVFKTMISVDEKGTEAASAGMAFIANAIMPEVIVNRPFFFVIMENSTKTILFLGRVMNPAEQNVNSAGP